MLDESFSGLPGFQDELEMTCEYSHGKFCSFSVYAIGKLARYISLTLKILQQGNYTQFESGVSFDQIYENRKAVPPDENTPAKMP